MDVDRATVTTALREQYAALTQVVEELEEHTFLRSTWCSGWCVRDLLFHVLLDAQRALVTLSTPATGQPDRDLVSYWQEFTRGTEQAEEAAKAHARFVRLSSSAYSGAAALVEQWRATADAAVQLADSCPHDSVATQGHVLTVTDFVGTLAVEAAVHHLDLTKELPEAPTASPTALALARHTMDGLLGATPPARWDDVTYVLKGTGRLPLDRADRTTLRDAADRIPLFG